MSAVADQTSGHILKRIVEFVERKFGPKAVRYLQENGDLRVDLDVVIKSMWYPTDAYHRLLATITERLFKGNPKYCAAIGGFAMEEDLNDVFRAFVDPSNPRCILSMAPELWSQYRRGGTLSVVEEGDNHAVLSLEGGDQTSIHEWYLAIGGWQKAIQLSGGSNCRVSIQGGLNADRNSVTTRFDWD